MSIVNGTGVLRFAKLTDKAFAPMKGSKCAAGYDLRRYVLLHTWVGSK